MNRRKGVDFGETAERLFEPTCGYTIEKEWPGHRVVLFRRSCKRRVRWWGDRCWQHGGPARLGGDADAG